MPKKIIMHLLVLSLFLCHPGFAKKPAYPPKHYQEHCPVCHARITGGSGDALYKRKDGLVYDLKSLDQRVTYCRKSLGLAWDPQQSQAVIEYLNTHFYRFR